MTIAQIIGVILILAILSVMVLAANSIEDVDWEGLERSDREEEEMP